MAQETHSASSWFRKVPAILFYLALGFIIAPSRSTRVDHSSGDVVTHLNLGFPGMEWLTLTTERINELSGQTSSEWTLALQFNALLLIPLLYLLCSLGIRRFNRSGLGHRLGSVVHDWLESERNTAIRNHLNETRYFQRQRRIAWNALMAAAGTALAINLLLASPYRHTVEFNSPQAARSAEAQLTEAFEALGHRADLSILDDGIGATLVIEGRQNVYFARSASAEALGRNRDVKQISFELGHRPHPFTFWAAALAALLYLLRYRRRPDTLPQQPDVAQSEPP